MIKFLIKALPDYLLCACLTTGTALGICSGFLLEDPISGNGAAILGISLLLQLLLTAISFRPVLRVLGICAGVVLAGGTAFWAQAFHPMESESENSLFIFILIEIITAVLVFLLTRTRPGTAALFILGTIIQAGAKFLAWPVPLWSFLLFEFCVAAMYFYRTFRVAYTRSDMGKSGGRSFAAQLLVTCLAGLLAASLIFAGIVKPLNPPVRDLKLITQLRSMDLFEVLGIYNVETVLDPDLTSSKDSSDMENGNQKGDQEEDSDDGSSDDENLPGADEEQEGNTNASFHQLLEAIWYDFSSGAWILVLAAVILLITAAVLSPAARRRLWLKRLQLMSEEDQAAAYYSFFLKKLSRAGIKKPENQTLREFSSASAHALSAYDADEVTFGDLTSLYEKVLYGHSRIEESELEMFRKFYSMFHKNMRQEIGSFKYLLKWFLLK